MNPTAKDHELADHIRTLRALGLHGEAIAQHPLVARHPSLLPKRPPIVNPLRKPHGLGGITRGPSRPPYDSVLPRPSGGAMAPPRPPVRPIPHISTPPRFNFATGTGGPGNFPH